MTEKAKEAILPHVRNLIKSVTKLEPGEDGYSRLEHHVFSNIWSEKYVAVNRHSVKKSIDGVIEKFIIHSRSEDADRLKELVDKFLSSKAFDDCEQYHIQWYLLSLLLHLANNPTSAHNIEPEPTKFDLVEEKEEIDWPSYLLEGLPKYHYYNSGSETEDDWNSSDELQEECSLHTEDPIVREKEICPPQPLEVSKVNTKDNTLNKTILWRCIEERANEAEKWLKDHVQNPSCEGYRATSKYAAANLAEFLDTKQGGRTDNALPTKLMSEYRVLRETLWALQVPPSFPAHLQDDWKGLYLPDEGGSYIPQKAVTIPSLSKGSLQSHLRNFGRYISYVREIESAISEIFSSREILVKPNSEEELPPYTYEAYASALNEFLTDFKERVLVIEKKVKLQNDINTLLTVDRELEPLLNELKLVHGIHKKSICDWKETSNWYCACRLLTMLYGLLSSPLSDVSATICYRLFLKTFKPYMDIIHIWLTEGRLEDWRKEFIITKNASSFGNTEKFWAEGFIVHPYEDMLVDEEGLLGKGSGSVFPLGLLHLIRDKVIHLGKNMELLQRLDHLSEIPKVSRKFVGTLHETLKTNLESYFKHIIAEEPEDEDIDSDEQETSDYESLAGDSLHQNLILQLRSSQDYFLTKTFEDFLKKEDNEKPSVSIKTKKESNRTVLPMVLPIKPIIEKHFSKLLEERHSIAGNIVSKIILGKYALKFHLLNVRRVFLMEAGDLLHHFCSHIFQQAEKGEKWTDSLTLTSYLQECIAARYPEAAPLFSISISEKSDKISHPTHHQSASYLSSSENIFEQVDLISLKYSVEWPVNIVLNVASMESYNTVFQFLLKVRWALWSLQQLRFSDLTGSKTGLVPKNIESTQESDTMALGSKIHRMQLLRAWLLHFVGSIHAYLMGRVLHGLGIKLEEDLEAATDLDAIIHVHKDYLKTVYFQCLQPKTVETACLFKTAIIGVLDISLQLSKLWKHPSHCTAAKLCEMENNYIRFHVFLAEVLTQVVQEGYYPHMESLSAALYHSFPSH